MVNHSFQHRLIKDVSRTPLIALMAGMLIMAFCFRNMIQDAVDAGVRLNGVGLFVGCMTGYALMACFVTISLAYRSSNRIAGPVYRFKKVLAEISGGNLDITIRLREKDDLKDLAEDLNLMIKELRVFVQTLQGNDEAMLSCINELEDQIKNNKIGSEAGRELIETIQANRANIAQVLKKYTKD